MAEQTIVLAFSGGLDTSVCIKWLQEKHKARVVTMTVDLGMVDMEPIRQGVEDWGVGGLHGGREGDVY